MWPECCDMAFSDEYRRAHFTPSTVMNKQIRDQGCHNIAISVSWVKQLKHSEYFSESGWNCPTGVLFSPPPSLWTRTQPLKISAITFPPPLCLKVMVNWKISVFGLKPTHQARYCQAQGQGQGQGQGQSQKSKVKTRPWGRGCNGLAHHHPPTTQLFLGR